MRRANSIEMTRTGGLLLRFNPPITVEERCEVQDVLETIGFDVTGGGTNLLTGVMDITTQPLHSGKPSLEKWALDALAEAYRAFYDERVSAPFDLTMGKFWSNDGRSDSDILRDIGARAIS